MIGTDFEYYRPESIKEAVTLFNTLMAEEKSPLYYNGGTEIITLKRINALYMNTKAIIDIKSIPECSVKGFFDNRYVIGSSIPLAEIQEMKEFPLLAKTCGRIADHTSREKITLGGNICGNIIYKEAVLPLLLTDCHVVIASEQGMQEVPIQQVFNERMQLDPASFIVQVLIDKEYLLLPFVSKKITKIDRIGYPLLTVAGLKVGNQLRFAFSGLCAYPFRSHDIEAVINKLELIDVDGINNAIDQLPAPIIDDLEGSAAYRQFVLHYVLEESIAELRKGERNESDGRSND